MIIFESLLNTFITSINFWGNLGSSKNWPEPKTTQIKFNQVKLVQIPDTLCTFFTLQCIFEEVILVAVSYSKQHRMHKS